MAEKPENKTEDRNDEKKNTRSEWLLLLLSLIILILLLILFLVVGISYYKLERNDVFKIRGNIVYLYPGGEAREDLEKIIEDIENLPSMEEIERLTDPEDIFDLIDRIYEILLKAEKLPDEEKEYFDSTYRDMLYDLLDALKKRAWQIGAQEMQEPGGVVPYYRPSDTGEGRQGVPEETGSKEAESKGTGGSGTGGGGRSIPDGPIQFTIWDESGNFYTQEKDGTIIEPGSFDSFSETLYPGDEITKRYKAKIVYTGRDKTLHIDFKKQTGSTEYAEIIAKKLKCAVKTGDSWEGPYNTSIYSSDGTLKDMGAEYKLPPSSGETELEKYFEITISVPTTVEYSYSQAGSLQGKDTGNFNMRWSIN